MIELRQLTRCMAGRAILQAVDLRVERGEVLAIQGASGAGKTTLLRLIAGLDQPDEGEILLRGKVVATASFNTDPFQRQIGFQFQEAALWPHKTLLGNVAFAAGGKRSRAMECLSAVGLEALADRPPAEVSGGEARRAALARALAPARDIVLLDEPLTGLPAEQRRALAGWVQAELRAAGATCLWVSHDVAETAGIASRVLTLADGQLHQTA